MNKLLAKISKQFLYNNNLHRYKMKKISELTDDEAIVCCHRFCEENNLMPEFCMYREKVESEYVFCAYLKEYIEFGLCYDMQMICNLYIKPSVLPEITIDKDELKSFCNGCKYEL